MVAVDWAAPDQNEKLNSKNIFMHTAITQHTTHTHTHSYFQQHKHLFVHLKKQGKIKDKNIEENKC